MQELNPPLWAIAQEQVYDCMVSWRSDHIWTKEGNEWALRNPIWQSYVRI